MVNSQPPKYRVLPAAMLDGKGLSMRKQRESREWKFGFAQSAGSADTGGSGPDQLTQGGLVVLAYSRCYRDSAHLLEPVLTAVGVPSPSTGAGSNPSVTCPAA